MSYQTSAMDPKHAVTYAAGHSPQYNENMTSDPHINGAITQFQNLSLNHGMMSAGNGVDPINSAPGYMVQHAHDGPYVIAPMPPGHMAMEHLGHPAPYAHGAPYLAPHGPVGPFVHYPFMSPFTPGRHGALQDRTNRNTHGGHGEVPGLENRRGSYSTTESTPATPFYNGMAKHDRGPRVAVHDRSSYTTPSPQQLGHLNVFPDAGGKHNALSTPLDRDLDELLVKEPAVPKAVPAVFTPASQMKSLEQSLENRIPGNRNVYIRGLHPTTDDELLLRFTSRFGDVETSKAIIDTSTGACKGFGFAKFFDVRDSEMCIRGFHRLGYEVGFARESFNSRLKAEGDEASTNLYISNLPKSLTEVELGAIFMGYTILSSKILRDSMGNSRGVGFARFETRDICDEVIKDFNNVAVGDECQLMNIRYADTPSQKELKRVTAERRQFRTNEYNIGAYGTPLVGLQPNMYNQTVWKRPSVHQPSLSSSISRASQGAARGSRSTKSDSGGSVRGQTQPTAETHVAAASSDDSDEGVTIHAESNEAAVSAQSSPSVKKENE